MVNILVRGQTCSKGWSLDCSLQKQPICREGVMEAQRNRGLCNLSKFAATTIIRRLTQSGEWEALDVKECVKALRCEVKLFLLIRVPRSRLLVVWSPSLQLPTMWFSDSPTNCSASTPDFTTSPPSPLQATLIKLLISPPHCWTVSTTRTLDTTTCYCLIRLDNI